MTRIVLVILSILQALAITQSLRTSLPPNSMSLSARQVDTKASTLWAISSSSSAQSVGWGGPPSGRGPRTTNGGSGAEIPSKTAIESAVNVEWEPMTELERRIEDGIHYEHIPNQHHNFRRSQQARIPGNRNDGMSSPRDDDVMDVPEVRGVFCGYRFTQDDYNRLQSAEVVD